MRIRVLDSSLSICAPHSYCRPKTVPPEFQLNSVGNLRRERLGGWHGSHRPPFSLYVCGGSIKIAYRRPRKLTCPAVPIPSPNSSSSPLLSIAEERKNRGKKKEKKGNWKRFLGFLDQLETPGIASSSIPWVVVCTRKHLEACEHQKRLIFLPGKSQDSNVDRKRSFAPDNIRTLPDWKKMFTTCSLRLSAIERFMKWERPRALDCHWSSTVETEIPPAGETRIEWEMGLKFTKHDTGPAQAQQQAVINYLVKNFFLRNLVSKKRRRLLVGGYDLDMSYITDRVLAMSFPAERMRAMYRNPLWQVKSVLDMRHEGHYKVDAD